MKNAILFVFINGIMIFFLNNNNNNNNNNTFTSKEISFLLIFFTFIFIMIFFKYKIKYLYFFTMIFFYINLIYCIYPNLFALNLFKFHGRLGIKDPTLMNVAMAEILLWRLISGKYDWWKKIIKKNTLRDIGKYIWIMFLKLERCLPFGIL